MFLRSSGGSAWTYFRPGKVVSLLVLVVFFVMLFQQLVQGKSRHLQGQFFNSLMNRERQITGRDRCGSMGLMQNIPTHSAVVASKHTVVSYFRCYPKLLCFTQHTHPGARVHAAC